MGLSVGGSVGTGVSVWVGAGVAAGVNVSGAGVGPEHAARVASSARTMSVARTMRFFSNGVSLIQGIPASIVPAACLVDTVQATVFAILFSITAHFC